MKSLQEIMNTLTERKENAEALAIAWASVAVEKKKDETEFAKLGQAVKGAAFGKYYPVEDGLHPYLTIYTKTASGKYTSDSAPAFYYLDELPKEDTRRAAYFPQICRQTTPMTAEELRTMIKKHAEMWAECAKDYAEQMKKARKAYEHYTKAIKQAEQRLTADTETARNAESRQNNSLYYLIKF